MVQGEIVSSHGNLVAGFGVPDSWNQSFLLFSHRNHSGGVKGFQPPESLWWGSCGSKVPVAPVVGSMVPATHSLVVGSMVPVVGSMVPVVPVVPVVGQGKQGSCGL